MDKKTFELTLARRHSPLANSQEQIRILESFAKTPSFQDVVSVRGKSMDRTNGRSEWPLEATGIDVLQLNVGKVCNQTCRHCHVDAGPDRRETMSMEVVNACLDFLRQTDIPTLDITGGAPEMNPLFRKLVTEARELERRVIDRCNLTILVAPGYDDLPEFLAKHQVEVVASLPCYLEENVDRQRGDHVFQRSITALKRLNQLGYGQPDSTLKLTLIYNPIGPALPPDQHRLETDYRRELLARYGIVFTQLFTITNLPISRFLSDLLETDRLETYMETLVNAFNPRTLDGLMCRTMLSVDWRGNLYDCDFNQMLEIAVAPNLPRNIRDVDHTNINHLAKRSIQTGRHCFGCTAGAGSSCQGTILSAKSDEHT